LNSDAIRAANEEATLLVVETRHPGMRMPAWLRFVVATIAGGSPT